MSTGDHEPSNKVYDGSGSNLDALEPEKGFLTSDDASSHHSLQRQLKNRHVAMIR